MTDGADRFYAFLAARDLPVHTVGYTLIMVDYEEFYNIIRVAQDGQRAVFTASPSDGRFYSPGGKALPLLTPHRGDPQTTAEEDLLNPLLMPWRVAKGMILDLVLRRNVPVAFKADFEGCVEIYLTFFSRLRPDEALYEQALEAVVEQLQERGEKMAARAW
ncbi:hypothetical protein JCM10207_004271 [Rhodosporidiobolus poonsookiae]